MNSKETENSKVSEQFVDDFIGASVKRRTEPKFQNQQQENSPEDLSNEEITISEDTKETKQIAPTVSKRISGKQRRESLEEYREAFLQVPKIEDRKPVFVSCELRDKLDEIVRKLGGRKMSVSGLLENLVRHHLEIYQDDFEVWKKL